MATSLGDILSALKNGVIAINNLASAYSFSLLYRGSLGSAYSTLYTVSSTSNAYVTDICMCNTTASALTVYISFVSINDTASASNAIFYNVSIPAYSTLQWTGNQVVVSGGTIQAYASTTGCALSISGRIT